MSKKRTRSSPARELRQQAERKAKEYAVKTPRALSPDEAGPLLHELQVHQIELELQNEELHRAQAQTQEALARYTDLFDFAPIAYFQLSEDAVIHEVNLSGAALLGLDRSQLVSRRFDAFVAPACRPAFADFRREVLATDTRKTCEIQLATQGRGTYHVQVEGLAWSGRPGQERTWRLAVMDVTARWEVEAKVHEARDYAEQLIQTANVMVIGLDPAGAINVFNEEAEKITGYRRAELADRNWFEVLVPRDRYPHVWTEFERLLAGGLPRTFENPILTKSGEERLISWRNTEVRKGARIVGTISFGIDITERKRAEDALRTSEEFARRVIESSNDCIKVLDLEGRLLSMSEGGRRLLEIGEIAPYLNRSWVDFWKGQDREAARAAIAQAEKGEAGTFHGFCATAKGTPKWWDVVVSPIRNAAGTIDRLLAVSRDVTERQQIEQAQLFLLRCGNPRSAEDFFQSLARYLAQSLSMHYVCIDRLEGDGLSARTLAVYHDGQFEDNLSYALKDTPCGNVVGETICCFPKDVRHLFPKDLVLQEMKAESYLGTTLWSADGKPIGLIAVIGREHLVNRQVAESVLKLVAVRAAGELERLHAEEEREAARQRIVAILESIGDGFFSLDRQWRVTYINQQGAQLVGKPREVLLGRSLWENFPEAVGSAFQQAYERALAEQVATSAEAFYPPLNKWFGARAFPSPEGLSVFYEDITERKRAEQALRDSENRLQQAMTLGRCFAFEWNPVTDEVVRARECGPILGLAGEAAVSDTGKRYFERVHPEDRENFVATVKSLRPGADNYRVIYRVVRPDGRIVVIEEAGQGAFNAEGRLVRLVGIAMDVTERNQAEAERRQLVKELERRVQERTADLKQTVDRLQAEIAVRERAEEALRESEEGYRLLFDASPAGILISDFGGHIRKVNRTLTAMVGFTAEEMGAMRTVQFYREPAQRPRLMAQLRRGGEMEDTELEIRRKDDSVFAAVLHVRRISLGGEPLLLTTIRDVTRRRLAERHVQGLAQLLELSVSKTTPPAYLEPLVRMLADWTGCEGAGVRLFDQDGKLAAAASVGFPRRFLNEESRFCSTEVQCPCLRAARGGAEPSLASCITDHGSFFCGTMSQQMLTAAIRNPATAVLPCVQHHLESVAHVPIRAKGQLLGFLHLADARANRFPPETIHFLETAAPLVAETLRRFQTQAQLRESESRFRTMFESHDAVMLLIEPESGAIMGANRAATRFYDCSAQRLCRMNISQLHQLSPEAVESAGRRTGREPRPFLVMPPHLAGGEVRTVQMHASPVKVGGRKLLFSIIQDVTDHKRLERRIVEVSDRERQRLGLDLHDSLGGELAGVAMLAKALSVKLRARRAPERALAQEIAQQLSLAVAHTRSIAHGLCPVGLAASGLRNGLEEYAAGVTKLFHVACDFEDQGPVHVVDEQAATHLYRIAQEAVANSIRHGRARHILIRLSQESGGLTLQVADDGRGLGRRVGKSRGMGLHTMRYRAELIGAQLEITSAPRKGTLVSCWLPHAAATTGPSLEAG